MRTHAVGAARRCGALLIATLVVAARGNAAAVGSERRVLTNTEQVEALALGAGALWVGTRGGLERYEPGTWRRRAVYTTEQGLPANAVYRVEVTGGGVNFRTGHASCTLQEGATVACRPAPRWAPALPSTRARWQGARVTAELVVEGRRVIGTAGAGLWLDGASPRRLTPLGQLCSNHVVALAEWQGRTWLASFDEGLCSAPATPGGGDRPSGAADDGSPTFTRATLGARMINDLAVTPEGLFVATANGLFLSTEGQRFARVEAVESTGINDLAYDPARGVLWATAPNALWRVPLAGARGRFRRLRALWNPGGSLSLQAVEVASEGSVWLASEDRGALRLQADGRWEIFDRAAGLPTSWAMEVAAGPDGAIYVATLRHGLLRLDGRRPRARAHTRVAGLPNEWMLHASAEHAADGAVRGLWVGTQDGAARLAPDGQVAPLAGLPDPNVHALARTSTGVWVGTEGGTLVLPAGAL